MRVDHVGCLTSHSYPIVNVLLVILLLGCEQPLDKSGTLFLQLFNQLDLAGDGLVEVLYLRA